MFQGVTRPDAAPERGLGADQLFLVLNIIKQASTTQDPATFFRRVVETMQREVTTFSHVSIFEWDGDRSILRVMATAGEDDEKLEPGSSFTPRGVLAGAIRDGQARLEPHIDAGSPEAGTVIPGSRSALSIPIRVEGATQAVLNIESRQPDVFSARDTALMEILCEHLAHILHSLRLYRKLGDKNEKIRRVTDICRRVFETSSLDEALQLAVKAIVEEYGYYCACVAFADQDRHMTHKAHHAQVDVSVPDGYRQAIDKGIVGTVARSRSTVCCNDTLADPSYVALVPGVRSELCIPLMAGEALLGVLDINAQDKGAFSSEDIGLMETLAGQLALVIDKARLMDRTRRSRDYLETLIGTAGDGIFTLDAEGRITRWNLGMQRLMGYTEDEILGRSYLELPAPDRRNQARVIVGRVMNGEVQQGIEDQGLCKDGRILDVSLTMSPIRSADGSIEGLSVIVRDMTERKRAEENFRAMARTIRESEERFLSLLEKARDAIFLVDEHSGRILQANARAAEQTGFSRERLIGRVFVDLHPVDQRDLARRLMAAALESGAGAGEEMQLLRESGETCDVEVIPCVLNHEGRNVVQWLCRDISERRRAEKEKEGLHLQLLHSEKLSAIGQLISGVAHELNNPLTGVIGYSQLLVSSDCDTRVKEGLEKVYREARRCHRIVQNLLTFARKHTPEKSRISINDILESTVELRAYQLRVDDIRVETDLSRDLPCIQGDFHQLQQVFMNLLNNAHQAIKSTGRGGVLSIRTRPEPDVVRIEIRDDGPGIPPDHLKRIFDPFFTTKPTGQGTGLGLSICYGIIQEHDGRIWVESDPGAGSTFTIELPVIG